MSSRDSLNNKASPGIDRRFHKPLDVDRVKAGSVASLCEKVDLLRETAALAAAHGVEAVACPVCGCAGADDFMNIYGLVYVQCHECTHVYQQTMLDADTLQAVLSRDEAISGNVTEEQHRYRVEHMALPKVDYVHSLLEATGRDEGPGRWMDVACGAGDLLGAASKRGWRVEGLDTDERSVTMAKGLGYDVRHNDVFTFHEDVFCKDPDMKPFDVISCVGFFDAQKDPVGHLACVRKMLKPGGLLYVDQPNLSSATFEMMRHVPNSAVRYMIMNLRNIFCDKSFVRFIEQEDFQLIGTWRFGMDFYCLLTTLCLAYPSLSQSSLMEFCYKKNNSFQYVFDAHNFSDTIIYVARVGEKG